MKKSDDTARYTAEQLARMRRDGESRTDWVRFDATTQAELEPASPPIPMTCMRRRSGTRPYWACHPERSTSISALTRTCWSGSGKPAEAIRPV
jgi:hypothetical protein